MRGRTSSHWKAVQVLAILGAVTALAFTLVLAAGGTRSWVEAAQAAGPQLVSMEPLPEDSACEWVSAAAPVSRAAQFFFPHVFSATPSTIAALQPGQSGPVVLAAARPDDAARVAASRPKPHTSHPGPVSFV